MEILSPASKDRPRSVEDFARKVESALRLGIHLLVVDLFPPGPFDPLGIHEAIWADPYGGEPNPPPPDKPLTLASYLSKPLLPEAYLEFVAGGDDQPSMPLFLDIDPYVSVPLEPTYEAAYRSVPEVWRDVLEGRQPPSE